jgi:outer membrane protein assembly factor BamB
MKSFLLSRSGFITLILLFPLFLSGDPIRHPKVAWKFQSQAAIRGAVAIQNESLFFGNSAGMIYCLNKNSGKVIWTFQADGGISSKPAIEGSTAIFSDRDKLIYALNASTGKLLWKFETQSFPPHKWGYDYYGSSPTISAGKVFVGSGDQNIYALNLKDGKLVWKFHTGNKVRATPRVDKDNLYVPSFDGFVYVLNPANGALKWKFETEGVKLDSEKSGWDRCSINSYPAVKDSLMVFGSRDGNVYCVNTISKKAKWKFTYGPSWCLASAAIDENTAFIGWSDALQFSAINMTTGKEKWRYNFKSVSFSSPTTDEKSVYVGAANGNFYAFNKADGKINWIFETLGGVYASPIVDNSTIYVGSDDGNLYALQGEKPSYRAVFLEEKFKSKFIEEGMVTVPAVGTYFTEQGYDRLDSAKLFHFLTDRIQDKAPSVIVLAQEYIPANILGTDPKDNMIRKYMETGGKIVWTGLIINWFKLDSKGNPVVVESTDPSGATVVAKSTAYASGLLDVDFNLPDEGGLYAAKSTELGLKWGLPKTFNSKSAMVADKNISVLAYNELGRPTVWFKHVGSNPHSGFVNICTWGYLGFTLNQKDLDMLREVSEYGL